MAQPDFGLLTGQHRSSWIRLRTMIVLRWVAIVGQLVALTVAQRLFSLQLEVGLCYLAVGVSVMGNLIAIFIFPENKRLTEFENLLMVMFDLLQLGFLLFLTGGLHNPFALLLLGPVTISATILTTRSTLVMGRWRSQSSRYYRFFTFPCGRTKGSCCMFLKSLCLETGPPW